MKKYILLLLAALAVALSCTRFDDSAIWEELLNHKERIERLEAECNRLNTNINSLQTILEALQTNDYVTDIVKIMEDGVEVGYSITFVKGGTITIYHGTNGEDGTAPKIGIQKAADGEYYWTADGEWLTDDDGEKIPATAQDPEAGYITPQFRIADGVWYISFDGGNTWRQIDAVDAERDVFFQSVSSDGEYVYFVLSDDTELVIPYITTSQSFRGKVVSILGDSISTFEGWIPVEDGHNLTHRKRYPQSDLLTDVRLTWWHKLINNLGAKLGVNDSWAGSRVHNNASSNSGDLGPDACMASITRITNLGANGTPDLIFFYGGTNDAGKNVQLGTFDSSINHKVDLTATTWATFADAYAAAIMRMQYFYPDAKIIALTPMWVKSYYTVSRMNDFAEVIVSICDYFGVPVIDLRKCGINSNNIDYTLGDGIHPNAEGMDLMEKYIRRQLFAFYEGDYTENIVYKVTNNLNDAVNTDRYITGVSSGKPYTAQLTGNLSKICVKMGGTDITPSAFNAESGVIFIPEVNGDILIDETGNGNLSATFKYDVFMIPCYGQSLSTDSVSGGLDANGNALKGTTFTYTEPLSYDVNLKNTNIQDMSAGTAEAFRIAADYYGVKLPENFKVISSVDGAGGVSVAGLSKGTTYYKRLLASVRTAKASCDAAGLTMCVPCFTWTQGEEDMRAGGDDTKYGTGVFDPFTYKDRLKKLIDDLNTDIKAITGQTEDVLCVSYQVASHTSYQRYPRIAMQQQALAEEDDRMILAKTMYDIDYVRQISSIGPGGLKNGIDVHAYARSYRNMGNMYGLAAFKTCVLGQEHKWCYPISHTVKDNKVTIKFEVPFKPLVLDTEWINQLPDGNYGFNIYDVDEQPGIAGSIEEAETIITNVRLSGDDEVELTLSRTPVSGERLTYGVNGDYWQWITGVRGELPEGEVNDNATKSGSLHGARGCLRDSSPLKNNDNPSDKLKNLYNWCVIFEIIL
ncbi:MAG: hypothetical protein IIX08_08530 [Bacteroidales bacterium]|nr:hypothetical protein [Bacteroidales bacterium]